MKVQVGLSNQLLVLLICLSLASQPSLVPRPPAWTGNEARASPILQGRETGWLTRLDL